MNVFHVRWNQNGTATVLGRIALKDGSGEATGISGEGYWATHYDIATITCKVFDVDTGIEVTPAPTVVVADAILDTPVTDTALWRGDNEAGEGEVTGYNFEHDLPATCFPTGGHVYQAEYIVTSASGAILPAKYTGEAEGFFTT